MIILLFTNNIAGQSRELGLFIGGSLFHGDVGYLNAESSIIQTKTSFGFKVQRNLNYHFGLNLSANHGELFADDILSSDIYRVNRGLHFKSKITEIALISELNFRPYMSYNTEYNRTPYVFAGVAKYFYNPKAQGPDGNWYSLRPLNNEGQGSTIYPEREVYKLHGVSIPFGVGYKFNLYEFITLSFSMSWRITFNDYIDDVSTTYIEQNKPENQSDNNLTQGFQRGNPYDNDKYGFVGLSITYSIKDPQKGCTDIVY